MTRCCWALLCWGAVTAMAGGCPTCAPTTYVVVCADRPTDEIYRSVGHDQQLALASNRFGVRHVAHVQRAASVEKLTGNPEANDEEGAGRFGLGHQDQRHAAEAAVNPEPLALPLATAVGAAVGRLAARVVLEHRHYRIRAD